MQKGQFQTDVLSNDDNVVYWLEEVRPTTGYSMVDSQRIILFRRQGTLWTNNSLGGAAQRVVDLVDNQINEAEVYNATGSGPGPGPGEGTESWALIKFSKWGERKDGSYTPLEAKILDLALVIHAEHGGGNNSTFTTHVVTSSGTDTYSAFAAALGSLKGPKHGGANIKVCHMFEDIKQNVSDWKDDDEIAHYLAKILHKEAADRSGLIYGIGHAIYSKSDPRAEIFKSLVEKLAIAKNAGDEYNLYSKVERLAPQVIAAERKMFKGVSANVDFYSGFVYRLLGIPEELYTPIFAISRVAGWSAHRLEELINAGKIIRPAYRSVAAERGYTPINDR